MGVVAVHNFGESSAREKVLTDSPWIEPLLRALFPDFASMRIIRNDGHDQRTGIDVVVTLINGRDLYVDFKFRTKNYDDFALEYWSDVDRKTPGWIAKPQRTDLIIYIFLPTHKAYLLPFQPLRRAWRTHGREWVRSSRYFIADAPNEYSGRKWTTRSVCVPFRIVYDAMNEPEVFEVSA
jgi:hypothetical protein